VCAEGNLPGCLLDWQTANGNTRSHSLKIILSKANQQSVINDELIREQVDETIQ